MDKLGWFMSKNINRKSPPREGDPKERIFFAPFIASKRYLILVWFCYILNSCLCWHVRKTILCEMCVKWTKSYPACEIGEEIFTVRHRHRTIQDVKLAQSDLGYEIGTECEIGTGCEFAQSVKLAKSKLECEIGTERSRVWNRHRAI